MSAASPPPSISPTTPTPNNTHHHSLSSFRPAPVSPDNRKHAHSSSLPLLTAGGAAGGTGNRNSGNSNKNNNGRQSSTSSASSSSHKHYRALIVKIRDFAFTSTDERHCGLGPDAPKANRPRRLNKKLKGGSVHSFASSSGEDGSGSDGGDGEEEEEEGEGDGGWGGFRWGFGKFSWAPGQRLGGNGGQRNGGGGYVPSSTDFARNFGEERINAINDDGDAQWVDEPEEEEEEEDGHFLLGDEPLFPGLYRAVYAFEPEGTSEMGLEEGQVVRVVGRGGGVGWAVVVRDGTGGHALVPESYLEVVKLDDSTG